MEEFFATLTEAMGRQAHIAVGAAFVWGLLSILLSPCHLTSIPLVVGYVSSRQRSSGWRALGTSAVFCAGIAVTIALCATVAAAAGRMLGDVGPWGNYAVAAVFFLVGLNLLGVVDIPWLTWRAGERFKGFGAAFLLGLVFGLAVGPCTFAYMAPVLAVVFATAKSNPAYSATLVGAFAIGHCILILAAGTSAEMVGQYLDWKGRAKATRIIKGLAGAALLAAGLYMLYKA